jgi:CheY-like chemotaxis protein
VRALHADDGGAMRAIALTARAHSGDRFFALQAGFDMHLAKPVDRETLASIVAELSGLEWERV